MSGWLAARFTSQGVDYTSAGDKIFQNFLPSWVGMVPEPQAPPGSPEAIWNAQVSPPRTAVTENVYGSVVQQFRSLVCSKERKIGLNLPNHEVKMGFIFTNLKSCMQTTLPINATHSYFTGCYEDQGLDGFEPLQLPTAGEYLRGVF